MKRGDTMQQGIKDIRENLWNATAMLNDFIIGHYENIAEITPIIKVIEDCRKALKRMAA